MIIKLSYLLKYGSPFPVRGVMSDTTSRIMVYESIMVIPNETFSPDSTGIIKTNMEATVIRTLKERKDI